MLFTMIIDRLLQESDESILADSLAKDEFHTSTPIGFFTEPGTLTKAYELDGETILYARACKVLRLDLQFVDNKAALKNIKVMLEGFPEIVDRARENGFKEVVFNTSSPLLKRFCTRKLGFTVVEGDELRRVI